MQPMEISHGISANYPASPSSAPGRMDSDPTMTGTVDPPAGLSRRRMCVGLSLVLILFIMAGPNGLSLHDDASLNRNNMYRVNNKSSRNGRKHNKKHGNRKNKKGGALFGGGGGKKYSSLVDDDQLPRSHTPRTKTYHQGGFHYAPVQGHRKKHATTKQQYYAPGAKVKTNDYTPESFTGEDGVDRRDQQAAQQALPVYDYSADSADVIPEGVGEDLAARPAYDALECRSSVIDFVINATDVKDECEGLRKAFDKTCSAQPAQDAVAAAQQTVPVPEGYGNGGELRTSAGSFGRRRRRRLLGTAAESYRDESWGGYISRHLTRLYRTHVRSLFIRPLGEEELAFVEDEVVGEAWDDAEYQIEHGYDESKEYADRVERILSYHSPLEDDDGESRSSRRRRLTVAANDKEEDQLDGEEEEWLHWAEDAGVHIPNITEVTSIRHRWREYWQSRYQDSHTTEIRTPKEEERRRRQQRRLKKKANTQGELYGDDDQSAIDISQDQEELADEETTTAQAEQVQPQAQAHAPILSPKLPTASEHVAGQMLNDAVQLTHGGSNEAIAHVLNATNGTSSGVSAAVAAAAADAHQSAEAVSKATAAVSAVLNDPSSVEARTCCASILNVFHEHCDHPDAEELTDSRLFLIVFVIAFCGMVKSLIRHFRIRWLPEAAGCILVGVLGGIIVQFFPHYDFGFDGDMFLRVMVPPIVFEAALSIDKSAFQRHVVPIMIYAVCGTLISTFLTALVVSKGSHFLSFIGMACPPIPFVESLTFGALISSIDPIAVLSVLNNMGMSDTDTIYVLIFGESLLNDGVAIVLFQTLVHFLDESLIIDAAATWAATCHFVVVAVGSVMIGLVSGACCTCYYYLMYGVQTPLVEVLMFLCWAFIPYYICDGVEWSGIVAIVAAGFVMDLYVVGHRSKSVSSADSVSTGLSSNGSSQGGYNGVACRSGGSTFGRTFSREGHLSEKSKNHIHFVTEINATLMETAIFAYLGLFLFNSRYHWNFWLAFIAIFSCVASRAIMIPSLSLLANWLNGISSVATLRSFSKLSKSSHSSNGAAPNDNRRGVFIDVRMQIVLWFAGLRGAMSFALVENIPLFDTVTGQGSRMKPELKAMTSASIVFTVFVLGGSTYYLMERLGMSLNKDDDMTALGAPLVNKKKDRGSRCGQRTKKLADVSLAELGIEAGSDSTIESAMRQRGGGRNKLSKRPST